ncbi:MAG: extracellular solute-binding protein [Phototrophicaceae bacterium]
MRTRLTAITVLAMLVSMMSFLPVAAQDAVEIVFLTSENQPERVERQEAIAQAFEAENPGIDVIIVPVDENEQVSFMTISQAANTLPDLVLGSVQFTAKWVADGALDADRATAVIESLGVDTFSSGALALAQVSDGLYGSIPNDGWGQLLMYRSDLFAAAGLDAPDSYADILAAAEALHNPDGDLIGFCGPNAPDQQFTWQTFEHVALANGASFVDDMGSITFETPEMIEAMEFYNNLMSNYGPGETGWFWDQTRANYLAGRCAMNIWSPFILDEMAGLRDAAYPSCAECADNPAFIAENTDFVGAFSGFSNDVPAAWGSTFNVGISPTADAEAELFLDYWFNEAYLDTLAVAPEGKFPMRRGTADEPTVFLDGWATLDVGVDRRAPLSDFYSAEDLAVITGGADGYTRMGFDVGQNTLASAVGSTFFIQENLAQYLNGDISVEDAATNIQIDIEDLQLELE